MTIQYYCWIKAKKGYDIRFCEFVKGKFTDRVERFVRNVKTNREAAEIVESLNRNL